VDACKGSGTHEDAHDVEADVLIETWERMDEPYSELDFASGLEFGRIYYLNL